MEYKYKETHLEQLVSFPYESLVSIHRTTANQDGPFFKRMREEEKERVREETQGER